MDKEPFLRRWSGVVVSPVSRGVWFDTFLLILGAVGGFGLVFLWYRR